MPGVQEDHHCRRGQPQEHGAAGRSPLQVRQLEARNRAERRAVPATSRATCPARGHSTRARPSLASSTRWARTCSVSGYPPASRSSSSSSRARQRHKSSHSVICTCAWYCCACACALEPCARLTAGCPNANTTAPPAASGKVCGSCVSPPLPRRLCYSTLSAVLAPPAQQSCN